MDDKKIEQSEEEDLVWHRCGSSDSLLMRGIDDMLGLLSHAARVEVQDAEKQLKNVKKFQ